MNRHIFYLLIISVLTVFTGCRDRVNYPATNDLTGLVTPVIIQNGTNDIVLTDYFKDLSKIDSVSIEKSFKYKLSEGNKTLTIEADINNIAFFSEIKVWIKGFPYSIPAIKSNKINFNFVFNPGANVYKKVQLAGDFNSWNPSASELSFINSKWQTTLNLYPGRYSYQLVIDGKWMLDPANPVKADNNIGGFNSVLNINKADQELVPVLSTGEFKGEKLTLLCENNPEQVFVYWQNSRLGNKFVSFKDNKITMKLPAEAYALNRSYIRAWAVNKYGISNDIFIPLQQGNVISNVATLKRSDFQSMIMYFFMVDRFCNGDKNNDNPVKDPDVLPKANYYGGDLAGVLKKLKEGYFSELGINTIWLSPISQNPYEAFVEFPAPHRKYSGYHGYWPISSIKVDTRFGTEKEFRELVDEAHNQNINIILDYVSHHVHIQHPIYKQHPDWITQLDLPDGRKNIRIWEEQRLTTWFDTFLPTLDFNRKEVVEMACDSAIFWALNYGIDGYRHDATKHIPEVFWRRLTEKIKSDVVNKTNRQIYQIGETFGSRELIASYINSGKLDAQFDFNLYFDARSVFALDNESFAKLKNSLQETFDYYGTHNLMGNITGNHDLPRFISLASGDLAFNEDDKEAGWNRNIKVTDTVGYYKLSALTAFIMTVPGIPIIYYGDDIGMPGANDPDNRRMMKFENLSNFEKRTKTIAEKLIKLRRSDIALIYGDTKILDVTDKTFVFARTYFDKITIIAFNKDKNNKTINVKIPEKYKDINLFNNFASDFKLKDNNLQLTIKPYSFEILTKK